MQISHKFKFLFVFLQFVSLTCLEARYIFWDMGEVLVRPKKFDIAYNAIGIPDILLNTIFDWKNPLTLQLRAMNILNLLGTQTGTEKLLVNATCEMPLIMVQWQLGLKKTPEILHEIDVLFNEIPVGGEYFASQREKQLMRNIIETIFNPEILVRYTDPISPAVALLEECANTPGCTNVIISNWDPTSFTLLHEATHMQPVFKHIPRNHIFISGDHGMAKPQKAFFEHVLATLNIDPHTEECIFLDDLVVNGKAAQEVGIKYIQVNNNYAQIAKLLKDEKLLAQEQAKIAAVA